MAWYNPLSWNVGGQIDKAMTVKNRYQATAKDVDPEAYQLGNAYGGDLRSALSRASRMGVGDASAARAGAATIGKTDLGASPAWGQDQRDFSRVLLARAQGKAPSAAESQLRLGLGQALQQQQAQAASQRGVSAGLAQRLAAQTGERLVADTNAQAATLRAQEQAQAEAAYTGAVAQARGQELDTARLGQEANVAQAGLTQQTALANAGFEQQTELQNQQVQLQAQQAREQAISTYLGMGMTREQATQQALADEQAQNTQRIVAAQQLNAGVAAGNQAASTQGRAALVGMAGSIIGGALSKSDRRAKTKIARASARDMRDFVAKLNAVTFRYKKPEEDGQGDHVGIMAQDAEKSKVGRTFVVDTPGGKMLDIRRGFGAVLASQKALHDRIADLEGAA